MKDAYNPIPHNKFKKTALKDAQLKKLYDELEEEYALIAEMIKARKIIHKSQKEVAVSMHTSASVVARLEAGFNKKRHSPTVETLKRYAKAVGCKLSIKLIPINS